MDHRSNDVPATVATSAHDPAVTVTGHPAGSALHQRSPDLRARDATVVAIPPESEDGSLVTEYGLLAIVAATLAGAVISWASNGAMVTLFNALLRQARALVGA
jgi:hypothetical protein